MKGGIARAAAHSERVRRADREDDQRHQVVMPDLLGDGQAPTEATCQRRSGSGRSSPIGLCLAPGGQIKTAGDMFSGLVRGPRRLRLDFEPS